MKTGGHREVERLGDKIKRYQKDPKIYVFRGDITKAVDIDIQK